jgi:hypoxanthine phosphoribosyltransferase
VKTSGVVKIIKDLDINLAGYDVLVVEDILDSGLTLKYIADLLKSRNPRSVAICTLLDKPERRKADISADYLGFTRYPTSSSSATGLIMQKNTGIFLS